MGTLLADVPVDTLDVFAEEDATDPTANLEQEVLQLDEQRRRGYGYGRGGRRLDEEEIRRLEEEERRRGYGYGRGGRRLDEEVVRRLDEEERRRGYGYGGYGRGRRLDADEEKPLLEDLQL